MKKTRGVELFITGGTLLGLAHGGKLISSDDADLAYLSQHRNTSGIVLKSYEVERVLKENDLESVRHSSGHQQVMFGGDAYTEGTTWTFSAISSSRVVSRVLATPARRLLMSRCSRSENQNMGLEARHLRQHAPNAVGHLRRAMEDAGSCLYVQYTGIGRLRFYWWLNNFDPFREHLEDYHRSLISVEAPTKPTAMATWLASKIEHGTAVLEMGCGFGTDSLAIASAGHKVLPVDCSRPAIADASAKNIAGHPTER